MTETQALQDRVTELETMVARLLPSPASELELPSVYRAEVVTPPMMDLALLAGSTGLPHDLRELRQLVTAVALSRAEELPGAQVPVSYEADVRQLHDARSRGLSWRAALVESGLEVPDDGDVQFRTRELRSELRGLWDQLLPVLDGLKERGNALQVGNLLSLLRELVA